MRSCYTYKLHSLMHAYHTHTHACLPSWVPSWSHLASQRACSSSRLTTCWYTSPQSEAIMWWSTRIYIWTHRKRERESGKCALQCRKSHSHTCAHTHIRGEKEEDREVSEVCNLSYTYAYPHSHTYLPIIAECDFPHRESCPHQKPLEYVWLFLVVALPLRHPV
jgi:hypothetical protein